MNFTEEILTDIFMKRLAQMPEYREAFDVVRANTEGDIWLIGGIVSRVLMEELYRIPQEGYDFDFLVEKLKPVLTTPPGWTVEHRKHGNPTFTKENLEIDLFPITTHNFIKSNNLPPTIENFFKGVPFTIQALAFDMKRQRIVGETGIEALQNREYKVNNLEEAQAMAKRKGITVNQRILQKANSMGLRPVLLP
jgi:hypothetical protein